MTFLIPTKSDNSLYSWRLANDFLLNSLSRLHLPCSMTSDCLRIQMPRFSPRALLPPPIAPCLDYSGSFLLSSLPSVLLPLLFFCLAANGSFLGKISKHTLPFEIHWCIVSHLIIRAIWEKLNHFPDQICSVTPHYLPPKWPWVSRCPRESQLISIVLTQILREPTFTLKSVPGLGNHLVAEIQSWYSLA